MDLGNWKCVAFLTRDGIQSIVGDKNTKHQSSLVNILEMDEVTRVVIGDEAETHCYKNKGETLQNLIRLLTKFASKNMNTDNIEECLFLLIQKILEKLEEQLGKLPMSVNGIIPVHATICALSKCCIEQAGKRAGMNKVIFVDKAMAVAHAYNEIIKNPQLESRQILIFDFGAGSVEVSVAKIVKGEVEILATDVNVSLGGSDFDIAILKYVLSRTRSITNTNQIPMLLECETKKIKLDSLENVSISVQSNSGGRTFPVNLSRKEYEYLIQEHVEASVTMVTNVIDKAKVKAKDFHDIVLVGGSTRTPLIQRKLKQVLNVEMFCSRVDVDDFVALGAAVYGSKQQV